MTFRSKINLFDSLKGTIFAVTVQGILIVDTNRKDAKTKRSRKPKKAAKPTTVIKATRLKATMRRALHPKGVRAPSLAP